ncbi:hypothetical protein EW026_g8396 [Hermanssonia centrifuga]|uniref:GED domain-containing protein n=1 Tax=Hermanssonia centrifuga TaxID=98765 RepID=A0A4V3X922_9APHY|nr:hypothetical protein EW026_g8396 [Hermanssonia centrifuga]
MEIIHLVAGFTRHLSKHLEGTPDDGGLLQSVRPAQEDFKRAIRATAPDFRAHPRRATIKRSARVSYGESEEEEEEEEVQESIPLPTFLSNEEVVGKLDGQNPIYIDEVMRRADKAITRELPDHYPFVITKEYIEEVIAGWDVPARNLFDAMQRILSVQVKEIIVQHFSKFSQGGLLHNITVVINEYIKQCSNITLQRISWLLDIEKKPRTLNTHYYSDYRDKFLAYYRGCRQANEHGSLIAKLQRYQPNYKAVIQTSTSDFSKSVSKILSGLNEIQISSVKATDLPKLLPSDPFDPALHIMASVRAYFQVAYKRFADNLPMAIDHELILGLHQDRGLEKVLLKGLGVTGPDGHQRCKEFLQEPPHLVTRRDELQKKLERLDSAKKELLDLWL